MISLQETLEMRPSLKIYKEPPMKGSTTDSVYCNLLKERAYQKFQDEYREGKSISAYLLEMRSYLNQAIDITVEETDRHALNYLRCLGGVLFRCLEEHGCPQRIQ
jgi:hypothetical protein